MGMFDTYVPAGPLVCPMDGTPLIEWQGKDGPCALLVWHEGQRYPTDDWVDEELRQPGTVLEFMLPPVFRIRCYDCPRHHPIEAICTAVDGVWTETRLLQPPGYGEYYRLALQAGRSGRLREFVLIDLTSQMPYIPRHVRDWPRERLLAWLRVWGDVDPIPTRYLEPAYDTYCFRSWLGLSMTFALTDSGRMFIPGTAIEAWNEPPA